MKRTLRELASYVTIALVALNCSGCGTLFRKPLSWQSNNADSASSIAPASKSRPARLANWTSEKDHRIDPATKLVDAWFGTATQRTEESGSRFGIDSIQLENASDPGEDSRFIVTQISDLTDDAQMPEFIERTLQRPSEAKQAAIVVNQLPVHTLPVQAESFDHKTDGSSTILSDMIELASTSQRTTDSQRPDEPPRLDSKQSESSTENDDVILLRAQPVKASEELPVNAEPQSLLERLLELDSSEPSTFPSQSEFEPLSRIQSTEGVFGPTPEGHSRVHETVYFESIPTSAFDYDSTPPLALASWNEDQETQVVKNEHVVGGLALPATDKARSLDAESPLDWRELLQKTIETLEQHEEELPSQRRAQVVPAIQARLLRLSAGDVEGALRPIPGLSPSENAFWHHQLVAVSTFLDSSYQRIGERALHPATAQDALQSIRMAQRELAQLAPLKINRVELCDEVSGFGQYGTVNPQFQPGEQAIVYCELQNFSTRPVTRSGETVFTAQLRGGFQIIDHDDRVVAQQEYPLVEDISRNVRTDFYMYFPIRLPELADGDYRLNITIADVNANKRADWTKTIEVRKQNGKQSQTAQSNESTRR